MISIQSVTLQDLFVVLICNEAKESFAIVLTTSRCHFDEMVTAHRNEVLIHSARGPTSSLTLLAHPTDGFLSLGPLIQGR